MPVPDHLLGQMNHRSESLALSGIGSLMHGLKQGNYQPAEACQALIDLIQKGTDSGVIDTAIEALLEALEKVRRTEPVVRLIKQLLFAKNQHNLELFIKAVRKKGMKTDVVACAMDMISRYDKEDLGPRAEEVAKLFAAKSDSTRSDNVASSMELPTQPIDALSLMIELLKSPDEKKRTAAANNLTAMATKATKRETVDKIAQALAKNQDEFSEQLREVRTIQ